MKYILAVFLISTMALSGCAAYQTSFEISDETEGTLILISEFQFKPGINTVHVGDTVTWQNNDKEAHSLSYQGQESPLLEKGERFSIVVEKPGVYHYYGGNHPFIRGTLIVRE